MTNAPEKNRDRVTHLMSSLVGALLFARATDDPARSDAILRSMRRMLRAELRSQGLDDAAIDDVWGCTVLEPARFFSFRRDGKASGRHLSAIVPRL